MALLLWGAPEGADAGADPGRTGRGTGAAARPGGFGDWSGPTKWGLECLTGLLSEGVLRSGGTRRVGGGDGVPTDCSDPKSPRPWSGKQLRIVPWRSG